MDTIVFPEVHLPVRDYGVVVALVNLLSQDQEAQPASITQGCPNEFVEKQKYTVGVKTGSTEHRG